MGQQLRCVMSQDSGKNERGSAVEQGRLLDEGMMKLRILRASRDEDEIFVFFRGSLFAIYDRRDLFARNHVVVQLYLCHKIKQKVLSDVFKLTIHTISVLVGKYKRHGSAGIRCALEISSQNRRKINKEVADFIRECLSRKEAQTYQEISQLVLKKFKVSIAEGTIANWCRSEKKNKSQVEVFDLKRLLI